MKIWKEQMGWSGVGGVKEVEKKWSSFNITLRWPLANLLLKASARTPLYTFSTGKKYPELSTGTSSYIWSMVAINKRPVCSFCSPSANPLPFWRPHPSPSKNRHPNSSRQPACFTHQFTLNFLQINKKVLKYYIDLNKLFNI